MLENEIGCDEMCWNKLVCDSMSTAGQHVNRWQYHTIYYNF